tara:strand:- start:720 stop:914 length:195 start_codon:yes stop_codon:yes gene_type:complete
MAIEMWEYLTSRLLEAQSTDIVAHGLGKGLQKTRASGGSLDRINTIDNWKKLLTQASKSASHDF